MGLMTNQYAMNVSGMQIPSVTVISYVGLNFHVQYSEIISRTSTLLLVKPRAIYEFVLATPIPSTTIVRAARNHLRLIRLSMYATPDAPDSRTTDTQHLYPSYLVSTTHPYNCPICRTPYTTPPFMGIPQPHKSPHLHRPGAMGG